MPDLAARLTAALAERYALERELGQGGMAVVYCARDLRHDRMVAVKVVKPELSAVLGPERFLAEIRVTAHLQHPHILPLFDSGSANGLLFYVMPYIQGESLRDKLRRERQLPIDDAVRITREVASALDYAHRHGVIHRDIKPENILLHDGQALVADFGIALAVHAAGGIRFTQTGISLGTPDYMSPEQATADRELDGRSDVYSLGCVAYEMLAGVPPHTGPTAQAIVAKIVTEKAPPIHRDRANVPPHVEAAIQRALERLPADRFQTVTTFADALADSRSHAGSTRILTGANYRRLPYGWPMTAGFAGGMLLLGFLAGQLGRPASRATESSARFALATGSDHRISTRPRTALALSPDGSLLVYMAEKMEGGHALFARWMDSLAAKAIPGTEEGYGPFFSPDGKWMGFFVGTELKKIQLPGGTPISITDGAFEFSRSAVWTESDSIFYEAYGQGNQIWAVPASGGKPRPVTSIDTAAGDRVHRLADVLPGSEVVLAVAGPASAAGALVALQRESGRRTTIIPGGITRATYLSSGHLVYAHQDGTLQAAPFDIRKLEIGTPSTIAERIFVSPSGATQFALSRSGALAYVPRQPRELMLVDRRGGSQNIGGAAGIFHCPRFSFDGHLLAMDFVQSGTRDIWIQDLAQGTRSRLSFEGDGHDPVWSPDGSRIAYISAKLGNPGIFTRNADGSGAAELLVLGESSNYTGTWTPDGKQLVTVGLKPRTGFDIDLLPVENTSTIKPLFATVYSEGYPSVSPDGRWLAYVTDESGRPEVYVRPFPGPGGRVQVSLAGGSEPVWNRNGRELFYRRPDPAGTQMVAASVRPAHPFQVLSRTTLFNSEQYETAIPHANYDVDPSGQRFVMVRHRGASEIILVQNWAAQLDRERAPR